MSRRCFMVLLGGAAVAVGSAGCEGVVQVSQFTLGERAGSAKYQELRKEHSQGYMVTIGNARYLAGAFNDSTKPEEWNNGFKVGWNNAMQSDLNSK